MNEEKPKYYINSRGDSFRIADMNDYHLFNAIRKLERDAKMLLDQAIDECEAYVVWCRKNNSPPDEYISRLRELRTMRPDQFIESDDSYQDMVSEAKGRGIVFRFVRKNQIDQDKITRRPRNLLSQ